LAQKHLLHVFPTFAVGGSQMRFAQLVRLHGGRYRHSVIALDGNTNMMERLSGLAVTSLALPFDKRRTLESWSLFHGTLSSVRPDVLLTYNWGAIEWAIVNRLSFGAHHVHVEDGFGPEEAQKQLARRVWTRRLALSGKGTTVILPSRNLERIALEQWRLPKARVRFIPNGVDCARFAVPARTGRGGVIGTVATLRREKNIPRLLKSFAGIAAKGQASELLIVGDGAERAALEQLAGELGVAGQVRFVGQSNRPEDWLPQMDIFALSSDTEQMPLSLLEAMAAGLPAVATNVGDVAQIVSSANSPYIVPATDQAFQDGLAQLLADPAAQSLIGRENEKRARENFDENVMAARYVDVIG
jgi:glycosyltransferase involved in cell wall biosynthesis